jgi:large subunit ribosomal protein L10
VAQVNAFRRTCFEKGVEYKVYKNTLIKKRLENLDADYSKLAEVGFERILRNYFLQRD